MMELLKQLQKKNKFFLFLLIFFFTSNNTLAKIFSKNLELNGSFTQGGLLFGKTNFPGFYVTQTTMHACDFQPIGLNIVPAGSERATALVMAKRK